MHTYKNIKPQIWAFIKNSIFGNNRDPWWEGEQGPEGDSETSGSKESKRPLARWQSWFWESRWFLWRRAGGQLDLGDIYSLGSAIQLWFTEYSVQHSLEFCFCIHRIYRAMQPVYETVEALILELTRYRSKKIIMEIVHSIKSHTKIAEKKLHVITGIYRVVFLTGPP